MGSLTRARCMALQCRAQRVPAAKIVLEQPSSDQRVERNTRRQSGVLSATAQGRGGADEALINRSTTECAAKSMEGEAEKAETVHGQCQLEQLVPDFRYGEQAWDQIQAVAVVVPMEVPMVHMQK